VTLKVSLPPESAVIEFLQGYPFIMALHPQIAKALNALAKANLPALESLSAMEAREQMGAMSRARGGEPTPVHQVENRMIPGPAGEIPVRIYWPNASKNLGALLYLHGGGHVIGSLDTHDKTARNLCMGSGALVVSVDYRMGPEHKFPAAVDDSWAALEWLAEAAATLGADPTRIAVGGDSAGANLAAVVALMARDAGAPKLAFQVLIYPVGDYSLSAESYVTYGEGFGVLTAKGMVWFRDHYLNTLEDTADWRASPIRASDFTGLAPAIVVAAECDVLHDDGVNYAEALKAAGVPTEYVKYAGMIHGFFGMAPDVDVAVAAQTRVSAALKKALSVG
jgi:acetyl esterase